MSVWLCVRMCAFMRMRARACLSHCCFQRTHVKLWNSVKQAALAFFCCPAGASVGWAVYEMTGHANKLHHFCLCGRGQWPTICRRGKMNGAHLCWHHEPPVPSPSSPLPGPCLSPSPLTLHWAPLWNTGRHRQTSPASDIEHNTTSKGENHLFIQ